MSGTDHDDDDDDDDDDDGTSLWIFHCAKGDENHLKVSFSPDHG